MRLAILFLTIVRLVFAGLNSANARFAIVLRDQARTHLINSVDAISNDTFRSLMQDVLVDVVVVALASVIFTIFGAVTAIYLRWLRGNNAAYVFVWGRLDYPC